MSSAPNPNHLSPRWGSTTKAFVAGVVLILGALAIWRFNFLIRPLAMSLILAYLLNPIIVWMQTRTRLHRTYVVLLVYMALLLIWSAAFIAMGFIVADQAIKLRDVLPDLLPRLIVAVRDISTNWSKTAITVGTYRFTLRGLQTVVDWNALAQQARMGIQPVVSRGGRFIAALAQATLDTLAIGLLVFVVSIYMSKDLPKFGRFLSDVARQPGYAHDVERLLHETVAIWNAYLRGQIILSLVIGLIAGISLSILGVNYPLALGVLAGLLEFLHIIGPVIATIAAVLVALFQPSNPWSLSPVWFALIVLGVMFLIQQLEGTWLLPHIMGDVLDLHPIVVMVTVLMGASLAGLLGAILAAPVAATVKLYSTYIWRKMLDLPPFLEPEGIGVIPPRNVALAFWVRVARWVGTVRNARQQS